MVRRMRPSRTVAGLALTAVLALAALPGLVRSEEPIREQPIDAASFRDVILAAARERPIEASDLATVIPSAGSLDASTTFVERDPTERDEAARAEVNLPTPTAAWDWKPPKSTLEGIASFYSNGTT